MILRNILKLLVLPPLSHFLAIMVAFLLWRKKPRFARILLFTSLSSLWLLATPRVSDYLLLPLEQSFPVLDTENLENGTAQAIVVLAGGIYSPAPEFGVDQANPSTLVRMQYAAYLHRIRPLPILVTGGKVFAGEPIAQIMASGLEQEFSVPVQWIEDQSRTTLENAQYSVKLLKQNGIESIVLVSQAYHLKRAVPVFTELGIEVIPAPTRFWARSEARPDILQWIPSAQGLHKSTTALHEWLGLLVYRF